MSYDEYGSLINTLSTGTIIAIVISSIIGLAICIGFIILLICLIKHCSKSRSIRTQGMVLQSYPYPHSWTTQYPPNMTSVSNYPSSYQSLPPPYTASAPEQPNKLF